MKVVVKRQPDLEENCEFLAKNHNQKQRTKKLMKETTSDRTEW